MFDSLLSKRKNLSTEEVGGASNSVLLIASIGSIVIGLSLIGLIAFRHVDALASSISQQVKSNETVGPAEPVKPGSTPVAVPSEVLSANSAASSRSAGELNAAVTPIASNQLSLKDIEIYNESLSLINQFDGNGKQLETAYHMLVDLANRNPKSGYPYAALADLKYRLAGLGDGSFSDAYTLAQRSIALDPNIADAYVVVAKVAIEHGRIRDASEAAKKAIALAPNKPEAMFVMARTTEIWAEVAIEEGWSAAHRAKFGSPDQLYGESERWYRKAIDTYRDNIRKSNIYFWLGNMLSNKTPEDIVGATEAFTKSAELSFDKSPLNLNDIGRFLITKTGRYDQAIGYFEQALKLKEFDDARTNLGLAEYYKWGDFQQNPDKYKSVQRAALSPEAITEKTGVTPEYAFVMNASVKERPYASTILFKKGLIKYVDVVPDGLAGTALIYAATANHLDLVKLLIAKKANVNFVDKDKRLQRTAIFYAVNQGNFDMVKLLVENGARLNLTDAGGNPLIFFALSPGKPKPNILDYLLQHGADSTIPRRGGGTLLELAVSWNNVEAVRMLVNKYHAKVNTYVPGKSSSLLEGAKSKEVAAILLKAGANPWVKGLDDVDLVAKAMSPLNERNPDWPEIREATYLVLDARKRTPKPKEFGVEYIERNAIAWAVETNNVELVKIYIEKYHVDVNVNSLSEEPLLYFATSKNSAIVEALLQGGANPWIKNRQGNDILTSIMGATGHPAYSLLRENAALILEARKRSPKPKEFGQEYQGI